MRSLLAKHPGVGGGTDRPTARFVSQVASAPQRCCVLRMDLGSLPAVPKLVQSIHSPQHSGSTRQISTGIEFGEYLYCLYQQVVRLLTTILCQ